MLPDQPTIELLLAENAALKARLAELEQRRHILDTFLSIAGEFMAILDSDARYVEVFPTPILPDEERSFITGKTAHEIMPPALADQVAGLIKQTLASGDAPTIAYQLPKYGAARWFSATLTPLSATTVLWVGRDITEQRTLQQAQEELHIFKLLADSASDGILLFDPQGRVGYANASFKELSGLGDRVVGSTIRDLHPPEALERIREESLGALERGGAWRGTLPALRADGSTWIAQLSVNTIYGSGGAMIGRVGVFRDVTQQHAQERRLRLFEAIVENAADGVAVMGLDGGPLYANQAIARLTGAPSVEAFQQYPQGSFLHEDERGRYRAEIIPAVQREGSWQGTLWARRADGSRWRSLASVFLVSDAEGQPLGRATVMRDISSEFQAEEERAALQEQIITAQQAMVRELSTPLIPLTDDVVVMPLIGTIDTQRAQQIMEVLLEGVARSSAEMVLIDISGVKVVDTQVADALLRVAKAARLLGSQVVLTGISAEVAQTMVHLGAELQGLITLSTLQAGLRYAMEQSAHRR